MNSPFNLEMEGERDGTVEERKIHEKERETSGGMLLSFVHIFCLALFGLSAHTLDSFMFHDHLNLSSGGGNRSLGEKAPNKL